MDDNLTSGRTTLSVPGGRGAVSASDASLGFRNGFVWELIDLRQPQPLAVHVQVLNPVSYELTEPHESTLTPTMGDVIVDEATGIQQRQISLSGTFGRKLRTATGFAGAQGGGRALSGDDHHLALRDLFRRYSQLKQDPSAAASTRLIFHALREDDHFIVAKPSFATPRDARKNRVHYEYRISAVAIGDATGISRLRQLEASRLDGSRFTQALKTISAAFNDARAGFAELTRNIGELKRRVGNITAVMSQVAGFLNAVGSALQAAQELIIEYPLQQAAAIADLLANAADRLAVSADGSDSILIAQRSIRQIEAAFDRISMHPEAFRDTNVTDIFDLYRGDARLSEEDLRNGTAGATIGSRVRAARGSDRDAGYPDATSFRGAREVRVRSGDTVESIATRYSIPAEAIVVANDLRPPYILPGGGPGVLGVGDLILVPIQAGDTAPVARVEEPSDAIYGVDFALDLDLLEREGVLDIADPIGPDPDDAPLRRGIANVVQGTAISIYTERGTTTFLPEIGISRSVGVKGTVEHVILAALNLREAILSDDRIEGIRSSEIVLEGDTLYQEIAPRVRGRAEDVTLALPFGTVRS